MFVEVSTLTLIRVTPREQSYLGILQYILRTKQNQMREYEAKVAGGKGANTLKGPELSGLNLARTFVFGVSWLGMAQIGQSAK